jgi:hypothetical protein
VKGVLNCRAGFEDEELRIPECTGVQIFVSFPLKKPSVIHKFVKRVYHQSLRGVL